MSGQWAQEELASVQLGDERLKHRAVQLVQRLGDKPGASIPSACGHWAETAAAYRFLSNQRVSWQPVMDAHFKASQERMRQHEVVLCIQDTTELDYSGCKQTAGLGRLNYTARRGLYLHPTYVVSPQREPLGIINAWSWAREDKGEDGCSQAVSESQRWIESYERLAECASELGATRQVCVGDRESDLMALLVMARDMDHVVDYLVRCQHNRVLPDGGKLWGAVMDSAPLGTIGFELPAGRGHKARHVQQEVRVQRVTLRDPQGQPLSVSCLIASEINTPQGCTSVVWRLLTNRSATTLQEALQLIEWYRARWEIEQFFFILKEGCKVEQLQLGDSQRLQTALALYMLIAWRINRLMRLGRNCPELPADVALDSQEWQAAYILNRKPVPKQVPPLNTVVRLIAQCGGFLARKGDGEPGAKTLWQGMRDIAVFVRAARQLQLHKGTCV